MAIMEQDRIASENAAMKAADNRPMIEINGLNKWYVDFHVLKDINLLVGRGERIVICGPSGSGKSTLIRCINRLEVHQEGSIIVDGIELNDDVKNIEEIRRDVGMVFQHFNLFPHTCARRSRATRREKMIIITGSPSAGNR